MIAGRLYGSRAAQRRVRAFIDLAIQRLLETPTYVLGPKELAGVASSVRTTKRSR